MNRLHVVVISMFDLIVVINLSILWLRRIMRHYHYTSRSGIHLESTNLWKTKHPFYFFDIKAPSFTISDGMRSIVSLQVYGYIKKKKMPLPSKFNLLIKT